MSGPQALVRKKSIKKRQVILDSAARVFAANGYADTNLSDIAAEAGVHTGNLYYYFSSREDLVKEVLLASLELISSQLRRTMDSGAGKISPLERLQSFVHRTLEQRTEAKDDYIRAYIRTFDQVQRSIPDLATTRRELGRRVRGEIAALVREAQALGEIPGHVDPDLVAVFLLGATNWVAYWYKPSGQIAGPDIADAFTNFLLHGLAGPPPADRP